MNRKRRQVMSKSFMKLLTGLFFLIPAVSFSQNVITLQAAIDSAVNHNFQVQIARNNSAIAQVNNNYGTAGVLPLVGVNASDNQSYNTIHQELNTGAVINKDNASGNLLTGSLSASITLFNGMKITAEKNRLHYLQSQGEEMLNDEIQSTIASVMVNYFDIVRQQKYLQTIQQSLEVSQKKLDLINLRKNVGLANEADYLQAQIDVTTAEQTIAQQEVIIESDITNLQQLMGVKKFNSLTVNDTILIDESLKIDSVLSVITKNPELLSAEDQIKINEQLLREISSQRYPSLKANAGYGFNRNVSDAGLTLVNQSYGPNAGVTLQIPLYAGNAYRVQQKTTKYTIDNAVLYREQIINSLTADVIKSYSGYQSSLKQIKTQIENYQRAEKLMQLELQRYQLNQATIIDLKTAQTSFESAGFLLVNLQYAAKVSEIELNRLMFGLK